MNDLWKYRRKAWVKEMQGEAPIYWWHYVLLAAVFILTMVVW